MTYDTVVIGLGAMGAATLLQLARRGQRVLGIDRWDPPHAWGSTHGDTRITRQAIGEGEEYVPLVLRSHEIWREIEADTGAELLNQCGTLILAPGSSAAVVHGKANFVRRTIVAAERFGIPHEVLSPAETARRFPQFHLRGDEVVYHEPGGGYVRPERCVGAQLTSGQAPRRHGPAQHPGHVCYPRRRRRPRCYRGGGQCSCGRGRAGSRRLVTRPDRRRAGAAHGRHPPGPALVGAERSRGIHAEPLSHLHLDAWRRAGG